MHTVAKTVSRSRVDTRGLRRGGRCLAKVIEMIYCPGSLSDRIVHRSGTGSKGN